VQSIKVTSFYFRRMLTLITYTDRQQVSFHHLHNYNACIYTNTKDTYLGLALIRNRVDYGRVGEFSFAKELSIRVKLE
jgi:hypothetical protein